ncbi:MULTISPECIES: hypothetical protein [Haloferax]|uniref:Uncharacterized protein n=1 Tax=Haloferax massiliensis TaxID=1476858 RepID=A0A0D6JVM1_9EURY|nr:MULTISPECIES: hypothetical protein [Haloferax]MDS0242230.1 hypothetical protein [Haloferax sp. S2CR25]MDS0445351.1 hypothetical protein [Haloferax sp. S2CR25-2]CQR53007.1 hypothetical protein BN996_03411 [Haloferax massiliensis]
MASRLGAVEGLVVLGLVLLVATTAVPTASVVDFDARGGGSTVAAASAPNGPKSVDDVRLVAVGERGDRLWPFTSRDRSFDSLTLPVNLVVEGNPARVRSLLLYSRDATWDETNESWQQASAEQAPTDEVDAPWGAATGADRFTFVDTADSGGLWIAESMQLHDGTYFGSRIHLRLYGGGAPDDSWTAIQAHRDYWDWFRLRHTVTSLAGPQHVVERDLLRQPTVVDVRRERFANGGIIDADGWVSVVELGPPQLSTLPKEDLRRPATVESATDRGDAAARADPERDAAASALGPPTTTAAGVGNALSILAVVFVGVGGLAALFTRRDGMDMGVVVERLRWSRLADYRFQRGVALFVALAALPLLVRSAALGFESVVPNHPKVVAGLLYPVFAAAPVVLAVRLPRGYRPELWFGVAFVGYGVGLVADFASIQVAVVPVEIVLHRFAVLVALGALAVVGQRRFESSSPRRTALSAAVCLWVLLLAWPLFLGV